MLVGSYVFRRTRGWAMGASFSEPATLGDLGHSVHYLYTDEKSQRNSKL